MTKIIDDIKLTLELDDTDVYDEQLLRIINSALSVLKLNKIPVPDGAVTKDIDSSNFNLKDESHYGDVVDWICWYTLLRFDRKIDRFSYANVKSMLDETMSRLKAVYDREVVT